MSATPATERLTLMNDESRGQAIKRRMDYLGETPTSLARRASVDRGTVNRAIEDHPGVKPVSYQAIENVLTQLEHENGVEEGEATLTEIPGEIVELNVEIEGGVTIRAAVKGPLSHAGELERLIAHMARTSLELAKEEDAAPSGSDGIA